MFTLECSALPTTARVVAFQGHEAISQLYRFAIGLVVPHGETIAANDAINTRATLEWPTEHGPQHCHGIVTAIDMVHAWQDHSLYRLILQPELSRLERTRHSAVYVGEEAPALWRSLTHAQGSLPSGYAKQALSASYAPPRLHVCQYKESNLQFLSRQLERAGAYYYFSHDGEALSPEQLVITDHKEHHMPSREQPVRYVPLTNDAAMSGDAMDGWVMRTSAQPRDVTTDDFDPLHPALNVTGGPVAVSQDGGGGHSYHGDDVRTPDEAKRQSTLRAEAMQASRVRFVGNGHVGHLRAGYTFELSEHPHDNMNCRYLAVEVHHYGNDGADGATLAHLQMRPLPQSSTYRCAVTAITADVQYRHPRLTRTPRIDGVERAFVDGSADSDYAQIDEHGRYKVAIHFDERWRSAPDGEGNCSTWVRMLQPHGGVEEGFHFPLRKGTEVMVSFVGGDPDRPVIIGVAPNALQPSPVRKANYTQNVVQTGGRNRIEMEDEKGKQYIDISTPPKKTWMHLGEPHDKHGAYLFFKTDGNQCINIGSTRDIEVGEALSEHVKGHVGWTHDSGRKDVVTGGNVVEEYGENHDTLIGGSRQELVTGNVFQQYKSWESVVDGSVRQRFGSQKTTIKGALSFGAAGGTKFHTTTYQLEASGNVAIGCGGTMSIDAGGGLTVQAPSITMTAGDIKLVHPNKVDFGAIETKTYGVKLSAYGLKMDVAATKIDVYPVAVKASLYAGYKAALRNAQNGVDSESGGVKTGTNGIRSFVAGIFVFS